VLGPAGQPSGTVERPEVGEAVLQRIGLRLPPQLLATARRLNAYPLGLALPQLIRAMEQSGELDADVQDGASPAASGSRR
jgi:hypothetical protein